MSTKIRPLFLVITDSSFTLDYMNKNARLVLNKRIVWKLRKSTKLVIQCHICQGWGHATSNCGRPPKCLTCARKRLTRICVKTRETPATCANCGGDNPAKYTRCRYYMDRVERLQTRKVTENRKLVPAPAPKENAWERRQRLETTERGLQREEFLLLPSQHSRARPLANQSNNRTSENTTRSMKNTNRSRPGAMDDVSALNRELNNQVNLSELAKAVRELNDKLRQCLTNLDIFYTYQEFNNNIDRYNFRN